MLRGIPTFATLNNAMIGATEFAMTECVYGEEEETSFDG